MAATQTPNYGWTQPDVGGDASVWGSTLNNDLALIDAQVFQNEQGVAPIGTIMMFGGATPPAANWLLCQGQSLSTTTYASLFAVIGYAFGGSGANFNLPNLQQRFPLGAESTNTLGSIGGFLNQTLTVANLPAHAHPITDVAHTHGASQPAHVHPDPGHGHGASAAQAPHSHDLGGDTINTAGGGLTPGGSAFGLGGRTSDTQQPAVSISITAATTGLQAAQPAITVAASGTGLSTTQNVGSGTPVNTVPPFQALNFIIRYV